MEWTPLKSDSPKEIKAVVTEDALPHLNLVKMHVAPQTVAAFKLRQKFKHTSIEGIWEDTPIQVWYTGSDQNLGFNMGVVLLADPVGEPSPHEARWWSWKVMDIMDGPYHYECPYSLIDDLLVVMRMEPHRDWTLAIDFIRQWLARRKEVLVP